MRLSAIGDTCHVVPVVRTIQAVWPNTRIVWVIGKLEASLMAGLDGVEFIIFDKTRGWRAYQDLRVNWQAATSACCCVCTRPCGQTWLHALSRRISAGFRPRASQGLPVVVHFPQDRGRPQDSTCWTACSGFSGPWVFRKRYYAGIFPFPTTTAHLPAMQIPDQDRPTLVISPCSSHRARNFRNWGAEQYAQVCDYVAATYGARVVLTGGSSNLERNTGCRSHGSVVVRR